MTKPLQILVLFLTVSSGVFAQFSNHDFLKHPGLNLTQSDSGFQFMQQISHVPSPTSQQDTSAGQSLAPQPRDAPQLGSQQLPAQFFQQTPPQTQPQFARSSPFGFQGQPSLLQAPQTQAAGQQLSSQPQFQSLSPQQAATLLRQQPSTTQMISPSQFNPQPQFAGQPQFSFQPQAPQPQTFQSPFLQPQMLQTQQAPPQQTGGFPFHFQSPSATPMFSQPQQFQQLQPQAPQPQSFAPQFFTSMQQQPQQLQPQQLQPQFQSPQQQPQPQFQSFSPQLTPQFSNQLSQLPPGFAAAPQMG